MTEINELENISKELLKVGSSLKIKHHPKENFWEQRQDLLDSLQQSLEKLYKEKEFLLSIEGEVKENDFLQDMEKIEKTIIQIKGYILHGGKI